MKWQRLLLLALLWSVHAVAKPIPLTFDQLNGLFDTPRLEEVDGKEVEVRGFFYRTGEGEAILARQPNLRSCCVGYGKNLSRQLYLRGKLPEIDASKAVTLVGNFSKEPIYGRKGELLRIYALDNVRLVEEMGEEKHTFFLLLALSALALFGGALLFYKRRGGL